VTETDITRVSAALADRYRIERELGAGGMSRVFVAEELALGRMVVIKLLRPEQAAVVSTERFAREVQVVARLQQANIVPLLSAGEAAGLPYYTMPFVAGQSLRARLSTGEPLSLSEVVSILRDVARGLAFAHQAGVVHRDIKPENVLMSGGTAVVTDFGIAKAIAASRTLDAAGEHAATLTEVGTTLGTPAYMAPEQATGDPSTDHRADIYAFGCLAYELVTGQSPFGKRAHHELLAAHMNERPAAPRTLRPDVPAGLEAVIMRCLEKLPSARPQSAAELLQALDNVTTPSSVTARPSRRRGAILAIAAALGFLILGVWFAQRRAAKASASHTIAVIHLTPPQADTAQEYFAAGIADELTTSLSQVPSLAVISRGAASQFNGPTVDPKAVSAKLGVDHIVELRVKRIGPTVAVYADLVNGATGVTVWSNRFEREISSVFALESDISSGIVTALQVRTTASRVQRRREPKPEAFEAYLTGRYLLNKSLDTKQQFDQALEHFARANALDPEFAEPYAAAAHAYQLASGLYYPMQDAYARADSLARRALALDDGNALAHATFGFAAAIRRWEWATARREIDRAIALNPSDAYVRLDHLFYLGAQGDLRGALEEGRIGRRLDPTNLSNLLMMEYLWFALGEPDSALATHRRIEELNPGMFLETIWVSDSYRAKGMLDSALALDRAMSARIGRPTSQLVLSLAALGRKAEAEAAYQKLVEANKSQLLMPEWLARAAMAIGKRDAALAWIEAGINSHSDLVHWAHTYPELRPLRTDPRFQRLRDRVGLPR